jgi:hypothetical protein
MIGADLCIIIGVIASIAATIGTALYCKDDGR